MDPNQKFPNKTASKEKYTGKQLVMLGPNSGFKDIRQKAGDVSLRLAPSSDYQNGGQAYKKAFDEADGIVFEQFGVAVINPDHEQQINTLRESARTQNTFLYSEPERY